MAGHTPPGSEEGTVETLGPARVQQGVTELDYAKVNRYWHEARPSILGPYMMDGFGFPAGAGRYRFRAETIIARRLTAQLSRSGSVLDLGSGVGYWSEHFSRRFARVIAIEASMPLFQATKERCRRYSNVTAVHGDVLQYQPKGTYELVFLGGLLMYLNESDAMALLRKLRSVLQPGGVILCRETTVPRGIITRQGEYQAVYRSVPTYQRIFENCGLCTVQAELNTPYVLMQIGCEIIKGYKKISPGTPHFLPLLGHLLYWGLRIGNPWITQVPGALGLDFPELRNHFFVLKPASPRTCTHHAESTSVKGHPCKPS